MTKIRWAMSLTVVGSLWYGSFVFMAGGLQFEAQHIASTAQGGEQDRTSKQAQIKNSDHGQDTASGAPVTLIEGERVNSQEVIIYMRSTLIEEGDAVKRMAENEANLNNVRYNINGFQFGYAIASEKLSDHMVFTGPTKGWRATAIGEVSRWPPVLYSAARKETMRQAKLIEPVVVAEQLDEMNNLRVYYRPLVVGHDGEKYQEEPSSLAFFIHPDTGTRMTAVFRDGRSYGAIGEPLVASAKVFVKAVVPSRGSRLVPSVFFSKEIAIESEAMSKNTKFDQLLQAVIVAHHSGPLAVEDFKGLFAEMARHTGGETEPVARTSASH
jgi:hypothetical protein